MLSVDLVTQDEGAGVVNVHMIPIVSHDCELGVIKTEKVACVRDEVTCCLCLSTGGKKLGEGDMHEFRGELEVQHFNG